MFTVYTEIESFENIVLYADTIPNWYKVFSNCADVCLNISDADLQNELVPGTVVFEYVNANGGKQPIALADYFQSINEDPSCIAEKPRAAFLLNVSKETAAKYQEDFGVLVQSSKDLTDNLLKHHYFRELPKDTIVERVPKQGWYQLFDILLPPTNCVVMTDDYLLQNEEGGIIVGIPNLKAIFDAVLPASLKVPFHVLILTNDANKSQQKCEQIAGNIKAMLNTLRGYEIKFELVFTSALHKRKIFMNYLSVTCDKGFAMFRLSNLKTVRSDNDFRSEMLFHRLDPSEGDTVLKSDNILLKQIQQRCSTVKAYINANGQTINNRIIGDCKPDKTINNRLIQEI